VRTKEQAKKSIDVWSRGGERQEKWSVVESLNIDVDLFLSKLELVNWNYWNYNLKRKKRYSKIPYEVLSLLI